MELTFMMQGVKELCEAGCAFRIECFIKWIQAHQEYVEEVIRAYQKYRNLHDRKTWNLYVEFQENAASLDGMLEEPDGAELMGSVVHLVGLKPMNTRRENFPMRRNNACGFVHEWNGLVVGAIEERDELGNPKFKMLTFPEVSKEMDVPQPEAAKWGGEKGDNNGKS